MTRPPSKPVLVRVVGPAGSGKSLLIVALTNALRRRGFRAGAIEARTSLDGATATVLTTGSGARITLPGALAVRELASTAAAFDPALDVLLAEGYLADGDDGPTGAALEIIEGDARPTTPSTELLAVVTREQLARAFAASGPVDDLGLAGIIEERLLGARTRASTLARVTGITEAPIETARRLLERPGGLVPPSRPRARGWRRWLGG